MNEIYKGTLIEYDEQHNRWTFTLRGRERSCASLKEAKEVVDRPQTTKKEKVFEPINGWLVDYSANNILPGRVTSFALPRYGQDRIRFVETNEARTSHEAARTENSDNFFPCNPTNDKIIEAIKVINIERERSWEARDKARRSLTKISPLLIPD